MEEPVAGTPDVPNTDVVRSGDKRAGVMVGTVGGISGTAGALLLTTVQDMSVGPGGFLYAATPGRGIWRTPLSSL